MKKRIAKSPHVRNRPNEGSAWASPLYARSLNAPKPLPQITLGIEKKASIFSKLALFVREVDFSPVEQAAVFKVCS